MVQSPLIAPEAGLRERHKRRRRGAILQAVRDLLRDDPERELSKERIAERAEVAPATVYNLVGTRARLWEALAEDFMDELEGRLVQHRDRDPVARVRQVVGHTVTLFVEDPVVSARMLRGWEESGLVLRRGPITHLAAALRAGQDAGVLVHKVDVQLLASSIASGCIGALHQWAARLIDDRKFRARAPGRRRGARRRGHRRASRAAPARPPAAPRPGRSMIAPRSVSLAGSGGLRLAAEVWGDASRSPLLLLHGGGQTRGAWASAGAKLSALGWTVIAPDLRGHGESAWSAEGRYSVVDFADDVRALASELDQPPVLVGASLGGLSSLLAAGEAPAIAVRALVLVDVAHRPQPAGVSRILDFMTGRPEGFASLEDAAAAIASYLPHRAAPDSLDGLQRNLRRRGGRWVWHWDPRLLDGIALPEAARILRAARAISAPMLLVRGALSDVISEAIARELCTEVPGLAKVDVAGAGHMVAGDRNDRFLDAITRFLIHLAPADAHALPGRGDATD